MLGSEDICTPGRVYGGRFRVLSELASGGMGIVYLAEDVSTQDAVAFKVLRARYRNNARIYQQFHVEGQFLCSFPSEHIARGHAQGVDPECGPFLAMELLTGRPLDELARKKRFSALEVAALGETLARAIAPMHAAGLIHRDLKPNNIMASVDGEEHHIKILDWGLAKMRGVFMSAETGDQAHFGTLRYMSPEQVRGEESTPASDVYALSLVLYELVARRYCYGDGRDTDEDQMQYAAWHNRAPLIPLDRTPSELATVIERGLARRAEDRYRSMDTLADALLSAHTALALVDDTRFVGAGRMAWLAAEVAAPETDRNPRSLVHGYGLDEEAETTLFEKALVVSSAPEAPTLPVDRTATLTIATGPTEGVVMPLVAGLQTVGRETTATFAIDESSVSGVHFAVFGAPDGTFWIEDCGSTNKTRVNGEWEGEWPKQLHDGDWVKAGRVVLRFRTPQR